MMFTRVFWQDAAERAVRTLAQAFAAVLVAGGTGLLNTDWRAALSTAGMAGLLSLVFSLAGQAVAPTGSASFLMSVASAPTAEVAPTETEETGRV